MSLEQEWKTAKKAFENAGGSKDTVTGFEPACRGVDSAYAKFESAGDDAKKKEKAIKDFDTAFAKLKAAEGKVAKFTGMSVSVKVTPKETLLKAAMSIVKAAQQARAGMK